MGRVPVEVGLRHVVAKGRPRVGVPHGVLHVPDGDASDEASGAEGPRRNRDADKSAAVDRSVVARGAVTEPRLRERSTRRPLLACGESSAVTRPGGSRRSIAARHETVPAQPTDRT